jgi:hypothetical protein
MIGGSIALRENGNAYQERCDYTVGTVATDLGDVMVL